MLIQLLIGCITLMPLISSSNQLTDWTEKLNNLQVKIDRLVTNNSAGSNIKNKSIAIVKKFNEFYSTNNLKSPNPECDTGLTQIEWSNCRSTSLSPNGKFTYTGDFLNGKPHGYGKSEYENNISFEGEYLEGKRIRGIFSSVSYDMFVNLNDEGKIAGEVIQFMKSGSVYIGEYSEGNRNGLGMWFGVNGSNEQGLFQGGKKITSIDLNTEPYRVSSNQPISKQNNNKSEIDEQMQEKLRLINIKRQNSKDDPISQALNYISGYSEDSSGSAFFAMSDSNKCQYTLLESSQFGMLTDELFRSDRGLSAFAGLMGMGGRGRSVDLSQGDPRSLQIFEKSGMQQAPIGNKYESYHVYISKVEGVGEFQCKSSTCNPNRIKSAWNLIYSKCRGAKKSF